MLRMLNAYRKDMPVKFYLFMLFLLTLALVAWGGLRYTAEKHECQRNGGKYNNTFYGLGHSTCEGRKEGK